MQSEPETQIVESVDWENGGIGELFWESDSMTVPAPHLGLPPPASLAWTRPRTAAWKVAGGPPPLVGALGTGAGGSSGEWASTPAEKPGVAVSGPRAGPSTNPVGPIVGRLAMPPSC